MAEPKKASPAERYSQMLTNFENENVFDAAHLTIARMAVKKSILLRLQQKVSSHNFISKKRLDETLNKIADDIVDSFELQYIKNPIELPPADDFLNALLEEKTPELKKFIHDESELLHKRLKQGWIPEIVIAFGFVPEDISEPPTKSDFLSNAKILQGKIIAALKFLEYIQKNPQFLPNGWHKKNVDSLLALTSIMKYGWIEKYSDLRKNKNEWMNKYAKATSTFISGLAPIFLLSPFRFFTKSVAKEKVETAIKQMQVMLVGLNETTVEPTPSLTSKSIASSKSDASSHAPSTGPESPYLPETWHRAKH